MAAVSTAPTTTGASMNKVWRKIAGPIAKYGWSHGKRVEKQFYNKLEASPMEWSPYENTYPLELNEVGGVASLQDSGALAKASSANAVEATVSAIHLNARFNVSDQVRWGDAGQRNQVIRQLQAQSTQKMTAMDEDWSDRFWGYPTALLATTDTDINGSTATLTLTNGYGNTNITNARYITNLFKAGATTGDRIAVADSSNVLLDTTDSFGLVTSKDPVAGTITVTFDGSITYSTNGIRIYKANNVEGTTIDGGTDYNKGLNGMLEIYTSTSAVNVSGSTNPAFSVGYSSTAAGRFTPGKLRTAKNAAGNDTDMETDFIFMSQGVETDTINAQLAGVRFASTQGMSLDGDIKAKGIDIMTPKGCPPGWVFGGAKAALRKWEILPLEGDSQYAQLQAYQDYAARFGRMDWFGNMFPVARKPLWYFNNQTEA